MLKVFLLLASCTVLNAAIGENLRTQPPVPPGLQKVALTNVQNAVRTLITLDVSTSIQSGAAQAEAIAYYCRAVATTFSSMSTNGNFAVSEVEKVQTPLDIDLSALRGNILTLYGRAYEYRTRGDLPPLEWLKAVAHTFSEAIREGIKQGGKANVL